MSLKSILKRDNLVKSHIVVIAHRPSTTMDADIIHIVDKGQIVTSGKHAEPLKSNAIYRNLYDIESLNS